MSLTELLKRPLKIFQKDVISFLIIRRFDLGATDEKLRYIAVRPNSSISVLRHKIWHLLDLPDFCEEIIIMKNHKDVEIPLTALLRGCDPQRPHILEVWLPNHAPHSRSALSKPSHMLTMGEDDKATVASDGTKEEKLHKEFNGTSEFSALSKGSLNLNRCRNFDGKRYNNLTQGNSYLSKYNNSEISCKLSACSIFYKLQRKKSRDDFANILLKIQSDLSTLSNKLSVLENKIPLKNEQTR